MVGSRWARRGQRHPDLASTRFRQTRTSRLNCFNSSSSMPDICVMTYPPDMEPRATELVMAQAEIMGERQVAE